MIQLFFIPNYIMFKIARNLDVKRVVAARKMPKTKELLFVNFHNRRKMHKASSLQFRTSFTFCF